MPRISAVDHVSFSVDDIERSFLFYNKIFSFFGMKAEKPTEYGMIFWRAPGYDIFLIEAPANLKNQAYTQDQIGVHHVAFHLESKQEVDELFAFSQKENLFIEHPPKQYSQFGIPMYFFSLHDPDGIKVEFVTRNV